MRAPMDQRVQGHFNSRWQVSQAFFHGSRPDYLRRHTPGKEQGSQVVTVLRTVRFSKNMAELEDKLARVAELMRDSLSVSTGHKGLDQNVIVYWTLATRSLPYVDTFPILDLLGRTAAGKTQTLKIVGDFAHRPCAFGLRNRTNPTIRDTLADCAEGTAIIEEADQAWKDSGAEFERMLSDRYQRASAEASYRAPAGEKGWGTVRKKFFGATALHRRFPFTDVALDGRTIFVRPRPDYTREYEEYNPENPRNVEGKELISNLKFEPPRIEQPSGVAGRIFDTYRLLLSTAALCGDQDFAEQLYSRLTQETLRLREAQSCEPDGLVLSAIVECVFAEGDAEFGNIKFSTLTESIWKNHRLPLQPRQIEPITRDLGFTTKTSHGVTVVVPTAATLLKACDECGYSDEAVEEFRRTVFDQK